MEQLTEFWNTVKSYWPMVEEVWTEGVFGVDIGNILIALVIVLFFLMIRNLFTRLIVKQVAFWASRTRSSIDDQIIEAIKDPIRFIPVLLGLFLATSYLDTSEETAQFFYDFNRTLLTFVIFWSFYRLTRPAGYLLRNTAAFMTQSMIDWTVKAAKVAFVLLGAAAILELWGVQVAPIIAGLGLFGVAVALGAQDLFKNLIAGLFVIGERRFHYKDWVLVDGVVEGTVEHVGFRTTKIRRFDKAPVYVPNSKLADNAVTNFTRMSHRRIKWIIGVEYRTTKEQLRQIRDRIEDHILNNEEFAPPEEVPTFVRIDSFNDSSIDILVYCFTVTTQWGEWLEIKERLAYKIKEIVEDAGTGFAFPSRSLYLESFPDAPDIFPLQKPAQSAPAGSGE